MPNALMLILVMSYMGCQDLVERFVTSCALGFADMKLAPRPQAVKHVFCGTCPFVKHMCTNINHML
jgi:hypothetical protein